MTEITFILPTGGEQICMAKEGISLMELALQNNISGIIAECNGAAACGTCHVVFDADTAMKLDAVSEHENDMLDFTAVPRRAGSRLSCQIKIDSRLSGARVEVPAES